MKKISKLIISSVLVFLSFYTLQSSHSTEDDNNAQRTLQKPILHHDSSVERDSINLIRHQQPPTQGGLFFGPSVESHVLTGAISITAVLLYAAYDPSSFLNLFKSLADNLSIDPLTLSKSMIVVGTVTTFATLYYVYSNNTH